MSNYDNEYGGSESSSLKYGMHPTYSAYHTDIITPEDYYTNNTILNDIIDAFAKFIVDHQEYSYLRIIDIAKLEPGDEISVMGLDDNHKILEINGSDIIIDHHGNSVEINVKDIRLLDDCLNKLKRTDISLMYTEISKIILNDHYSCIEFFNIFSEFFKINEKTLYSSLPYSTQMELMNSLKERLNINIINPESQLPKGRKVLLPKGEYVSCNKSNDVHIFNTEIYGEVLELVNGCNRNKAAAKIRITTETNDGESIIDVVAKISKLKIFDDGNIELVW
jgi:hypothetical protein